MEKITATTKPIIITMLLILTMGRFSPRFLVTEKPRSMLAKSRCSFNRFMYLSGRNQISYDVLRVNISTIPEMISPGRSMFCSIAVVLALTACSGELRPSLSGVGPFRYAQEDRCFANAEYGKVDDGVTE